MSTFSVSANTTFRTFQVVPDFKLSPCSECSVLSFGWFPVLRILCADVSEHSVHCLFFFSLGCFPGVLILCADVSEHSVSSICSFLSLGWLPVFWILRADVSEHCSTYDDGTDNVPKRRHIQFRRRDITQKKEYKISSCVRSNNKHRQSRPESSKVSISLLFPGKHVSARHCTWHV